MLAYRVWIFICTLCLSGCALSAIEQSDDDANIKSDEIVNIPALTFETYIGATHDVTMDPFGTKEKCFIIKPNTEQLNITEDFNYPGIDVIEGNDCGIKLTISEDMIGEWILIGRYTFFGDPLERRLPFTINIKGIATTEKESEEVVDDGITWLIPIAHATRTDAVIDITLSRLPYNEECFVKPPNGDFVKVGETPITGVTFHSKSAYVSCRITVGPMDDNLLGNWTLCGRYNDEESHERCQLVNIRWNNNNLPIASWQTTRQPVFDHPVHLEGILTPVVLGSGSIESCHIVTPDNEDLVITEVSQYPGIKRAAVNAASTCSVAIGPIDQTMLGEWILYGKFRNSFGLNEVILPMNLFFYDENNPSAQAYNVTNLDPVNRVINLGSTITSDVTGTGNIDNCFYRSPTHELFELYGQKNFKGVSFVNVQNATICRIVLSSITEAMLGEWEIIGKFRNGNNFNERRLIFYVIREDPAKPIIEEDRRIVNSTGQHHNVNIGSSLLVTSSLGSFVTRQSCHIRTPAGLQYTIMEGFNLPGVEPVEGTNIECGVNITVLSGDMVGEWTLISRVLSLSEPIERRLPFTIYVEEIVSAFPKEITVVEGNAVYVRLMKATSLHDTCNLIGPSENVTLHEVDPIHNDLCGFVIKKVQKTDSGKWEIKYGFDIVYRAFIAINIIERQQLSAINLTIIKNSQLNLEYGPEDAIYCKIEDSKGLVVFDGFGRCHIVLDRVTDYHQGFWKMSVGLPGQVLVTKETFWVTVQNAESKAVVTTNVVIENPTVVLTCAVNSTYQVRACTFRNPRGKIRLAAQGVGEDRYISQSSQVTYESDVHTHECGLRITEPTTEDLGLWRCAIETEGDTHYGFLSVLCPWLMQDQNITASGISEPVLSADRSLVSVVEGDATTITCSVESSIRYCYFRLQNGTVFSVFPAMNSHIMEYVGNGFDAGECGVRFKNLQHTDNGRWSCHVGFQNSSEPEQRAFFHVIVEESLKVFHYQTEPGHLVVRADVHMGRKLDYCRFVRIDGLGFTSDNAPAGYNDISIPEFGHCRLHIEESSMLNRHPWTVVVKVHGQDVELSKTTTENLLQNETNVTNPSTSIHVWITLVLIGLALILLGLSLGPQNNRRWTYARASQIRNSIRNSMRKTKPVDSV